ncbi:MAG: flagellar M-ring protein FliF [Pseudomonadota bacterium]|jgi:flagellar M-ring protein FliF
MSELVPAADAQGVAVSLSPQPAPSLFAPLTDPAGGPAFTRVRSFAAQPPVKRMVPWFAGVSAVGLAALAWLALSPAPQRVLYAELDDANRATVTETLDKAGITYAIDNATGTLTVDEDQLYRARMLVASEGALATPEDGTALLDSMPMGASRTLEGQRLRAARERELMMTIREIDGVESVRVHLAEGEKSVFVRDNVAPSASVMVRMARGRQLSESQVAAVVNLVAGSVPGLSIDSVRVVDQHGRLLSDKSGADSDRLELQARMEEKLRGQVAALLTPMLGDGNFTSEIQIELDMDQVTSARESYDKEGSVVRSETSAQSTMAGAAPAVGVPGALANTPPAPATAQAGPPQGTQPPAPGQPPVNGEASSTRTYELGREVAVANSAPGKLKRLSVAVAISGAAMKNAKAADIDQVRQLVSAAVGADTRRGDQVAVVVRKFESAADEALPFWETPWFAMMVRNGVALIAVLLFLLLGVRPVIRALKGDPAPPPPAEAAGSPEQISTNAEVIEEAITDPRTGDVDPRALAHQLGLAKKLVAERPDEAVYALRQMLKDSEQEGARA